jgi:hypothetical protein
LMLYVCACVYMHIYIYKMRFDWTGDIEKKISIAVDW